MAPRFGQLIEKKPAMVDQRNLAGRWRLYAHQAYTGVSGFSPGDTCWWFPFGVS
jgi:hypothetical protein